MKKLFIIFYLAFLGSTQEAFCQEFTTESGYAEFLSQASLNEFTGKSDELNGLVDLEKNLVDFYIDLNTLKTGIGLRDRHMRENYLETKDFPYAEFTGKIKGLDEEMISAFENGQKVTAVGKFKIHGVEREMEIKGEIMHDDEKNTMHLNAKFEVLLGDHDIAIPKVMFYELSEKQIVTINVSLKK